MSRIVIVIVTFLIIFSCAKKTEELSLEQGRWKAVLEVEKNKELPFIFEVTTANTIKMLNAEEEIIVDEITLKDDSIYIKMPVFEGYIAGTYTANSISGEFIKSSLDRIVPFKATLSEKDRFETSLEADKDVTGNWEAVFSPGIEGDEYIAKGIFNQQQDKVTGTFRTTTGDYRYLEGVVEGDSLRLSTFDGAHAFLFEAKVTDSTLKGIFYSGNHFQEPFIAKRNENYELPDADSLTFLKEGYEKLAFSFPDVNGNMISLEDDRFKNKAVVVQIFGTWCPNCLDETKFFVDYYKNRKPDNVEFVGLAFEYAKTKEKAIKSVQRFLDRTGVAYPVLIAQYGTDDKVKAQEKLPMLNHVLSYPTSIYIDKKGKVRRIHTGFNGPATGDKYTEFKEDFEHFLDKLSSE